MLEVKDLSVCIGEKTIVDNLSFFFGKGDWLMLVGPNGAGKTTVVNALSRAVPYTGKILLDGGDIKKARPRQLAKKIGVLTQSHHVGYAFTVGEVAAMGRYAYARGVFSQPEKGGDEKLLQALTVTGMLDLKDRSALTLSGGELQRTFLAQLFAQDPALLLLDEPTNNLDLVYQKQIFELVQSWIGRTGRSVISVVHDLSLARYYGTLALLMDKGRAVGFGTPEEVLTKENLQKVYAMDVYGWMRDMLSQWDDGEK